MIAQTCRVRRAVALSLAFLLMGSQMAYAGDLLDAAMAKATAFSAVAVQNTCQDAALQGQADGRARQGMGGWFAGGLLLSPFFVPIMPLVAHTAEPTPAVDALAGIDREDLSCYTTGYVRAAKGRRVKAAWIGYGTSFALTIALLSAVAASN